MEKTILFLKGRWRAALLVLLLGAVGMTNACAQTIGDLTYWLDKSTLTATVTGHKDGTSATGSLTIPSSVTYTSQEYINGQWILVTRTYNVTEIQGHYNSYGQYEGAFEGCIGLIGSLTIPNSVTHIGLAAFDGCSGFSEVHFNATNCADFSDPYGYPFSGCGGILFIGANVERIPANMFCGANFTGSLTIPNSVTTIGDYAFGGCSGFTGSLTIGNSVTTIGGGAFEGCSGFTGSLTIPNSVTTIGGYAFGWCSGFTGSLTIPNSVTTIGGYAFGWCSGFTGSLTIPNSVTTIGQAAFRNCSGFTGNLTIGNSVTTIGQAAFRNCSGFTGNLTIGNSVTTIGDYAFSGCSGFMGSLIVPNSVTTIGGYAFWSCSGFTGSLTIGNSVTTIGEHAFWSCSGFTGNLTIGNSVTEIGEESFYSCSGFTGSLTIPNSVTTIEESAFRGCRGFTGSLIIPNSVTEIGNFAFRGCSGFTGDLTISNSMDTIKISAFEGCSGFTGSLNIPSSVTIIRGNAFSGCSGFTGILTIPSSVTAIKSNAFYNCNGFTLIQSFAETPPNTISTAFDGVNRDIPVIVPCGSLNAYQNAIGWNVFTNIQEDCGPLTITAMANPDTGGTVLGAGVYEYGETATLTAVPNDGYAFINWTEDGIQLSVDSIYSFVVTGERTLVANFTDDPHYLVITTTANPSYGGMAVGAGTYLQGQFCTLTAIPNEGFEFVQWMKNDTLVSTDADYGFLVTEAAEYVAHFAPLPLINAMVNPFWAGSVMGTGYYNTGAFCTLAAIPNAGYAFVNWSKDGEVVSTNTTYSFTVAEDALFVANFGPGCNIAFQLNDSYGDGWNGNYLVVTDGNGNTQQLTISSGSTATYTLPFLVGSHLALSWIMGSWTNECSFTISYEDGPVICEGTNLSSSFSYEFDVDCNTPPVPTYSVTATASPILGGIVDGAGTYIAGATCTLTATANEGYRFTRWTKNGTQVSTNATYSFTVTEDEDFVAVFTENIPGDDITQTTNFTNGWNWWSTYVEADNLFNQLKAGLGANATQIKSSTTFVNYFNGMWIGGLSSISNESCYLINANNACTVEMTGNPAAPADHPITINPNWNWIGYPYTTATTVANAFSNFSPTNGDQVKSQNAFATYYGGMWVGGLSTITPGMGLLYKSNSTETKILIYPEANRSEDIVENVTNENNYWTANYHAYPSNMTMMAVIELDDVELQGENYEVSAFADGECRGSARLMYVAPIKRYVAFLAVAGEDAAELNFGLYNAETSVVETQCLASLTYATNAVVGSLETPYVIRFRSTTGVDEGSRNINIFPNPVNRGENIIFGLTDEIGKVQIEIVNALGVVVETRRTTSLQTINAPNVAGVYTLRITVEGQGTCYRKLVVR